MEDSLKAIDALRVAASYVDRYEHSMDFTAQHLVSMYPEMMTMEDEGKLMRWLGFMQGVLWAEKRFTLEQLKDHNRKGEVT